MKSALSASPFIGNQRRKGRKARRAQRGEECLHLGRRRFAGGDDLDFQIGLEAAAQRQRGSQQARVDVSFAHGEQYGSLFAGVGHSRALAIGRLSIKQQVCQPAQNPPNGLNNKEKSENRGRSNATGVLQDAT
jgi:hypothetical protein